MTTPEITKTKANPPIDPAIEDAILLLIQQAKASVCPTQVARALGTEQAWQHLLGRVRIAAVHMALEGKISILRKGKPVDPSDFKGVYRLGTYRAIEL